MGRRRDADQPNRQPLGVDDGRHGHRQNADGANKHCDLACEIDGPACADKVGTEPSAENGSDIRQEIDRYKRQADSFQIDPEAVIQEQREPEQVEPPY